MMLNLMTVGQKNGLIVMGKIVWCIETTDDNDRKAITNHGDNITGANDVDDRGWERLNASHLDYFDVLQALCDRVIEKPKETYFLNFEDDYEYIVQANIGNKNTSKVERFLEYYIKPEKDLLIKRQVFLYNENHAIVAWFNKVNRWEKILRLWYNRIDLPVETKNTNGGLSMKKREHRH